MPRRVNCGIITPGYQKRPEDERVEARAIANLHYPNILSVYDSGQEGGYSYIAMRYVGGARTLGDVVLTGE